MNNQDMPAYPIVAGDYEWHGLTKLEAFTMAAMQGMLANPDNTFASAESLSVAAIYQAEDALKALANRAELEKAND